MPLGRQVRTENIVEQVDDGTEQKKRELYKQRSDAATRAKAIIDAKFPYLNVLNVSARAGHERETNNDNSVSKG